MARPVAQPARSLLCMPFAGGNGRSYSSWQGLLPPHLAATTVQLPGRERRTRDPVPVGLPALAADLALELGPALPEGFTVFGHSLGGLLAYEFVREMRATLSREPSCLILSGVAAPDHLPDARRYHRLSDDDLLTEIADMGGSEQHVLDHVGLRALILPVLRADLHNYDTYRYRPDEPLHCPLIAYGSCDDLRVSENAVGAWRAYTTGPFEKRMFPGGHFYFNEHPKEFAADLGSRLRRYAATWPPCLPRST